MCNVFVESLQEQNESSIIEDKEDFLQVLGLHIVVGLHFLFLAFSSLFH
jgi:hypothetical protein